MASSVLLCAFSARAQVDGLPVPANWKPHWSGLPIWGAEAVAMGYQLPLPFGIGITGYSARQPVNLQDLRLGLGSAPPVSVTDFLQIDRVDTSQKNVSARFDVLILPFLDVYAIAGLTKGTTKGIIQVPAVPALNLEPRQLRLDASFNGPTYGWGMTMQGGARVSENPEVIAFAVADVNQTKTDLSFSNERLIAGTKPTATIFAARAGLSGMATPDLKTTVWVGAMWQKIEQEVAGTVDDSRLEFLVIQSAANPWNTLVGGLFEFGRSFNILVEGGIGPRKSILAGAGYRF